MSSLSTDMWHVFTIGWHFCTVWWHVTCPPFRHVTCLSSWLTCDMSKKSADMWHVFTVGWHLTCLHSRLTSDMSALSADKWHVCTVGRHVSCLYCPLTCDIFALYYWLTCDMVSQSANMWNVCNVGWHVTYLHNLSTVSATVCCKTQTSVSSTWSSTGESCLHGRAAVKCASLNCVNPATEEMAVKCVSFKLVTEQSSWEVWEGSSVSCLSSVKQAKW